jgi:hypothetical protein
LAKKKEKKRGRPKSDYPDLDILEKFNRPSTWEKDIEDMMKKLNTKSKSEVFRQAFIFLKDNYEQKLKTKRKSAKSVRLDLLTDDDQEFLDNFFEEAYQLGNLDNDQRHNIQKLFGVWKNCKSNTNQLIILKQIVKFMESLAEIQEYNESDEFNFYYHKICDTIKYLESL